MKNSSLVKFFRSDMWLFLLMLISALASLVAAFVLSVDAIELAKNPDAILSCDINAVLSCGTVAQQWQSSILGFPNAFIGLICEPVVITIAVAGLSGSKFNRWFMLTAQGVYFIGLSFALWLFYQSAFVIGAFCPWCLVVTVGTTITFFTLLKYNTQNRNFSKKSNISDESVRTIRHGMTFLEVSIIVGIFAVILIKYGSALFV